MSKRNVVLMQGNEACAQGALLAGCRFFAGYPITPSSEIAEDLSVELPKIGGMFIQMEDEIASMGAIIGASLAGLKTMTATSGPGFSLKQENLGYACFTEVPCVVVNVMRGGPSTGQPTLPSQADVMQAKWGSHGDHEIVALAPASVSETLTLTIEAFNIAEQFRVPVVLLLDEVIAHMREKVSVPQPGEFELRNRKKPDCAPEEYKPFGATPDLIPPLASFGSGYRFHVTGLTHDEFGFPTNRPDEATVLLTRLKQKIDTNKDALCRFEELFCDEEFDTLVIAYGSVARVARRAVSLARQEGMRVAMLRLITLWPFPNKIVARLVAKARAVIVPEMNQGQMIGEVERCVRKEMPIIGVNRFDGTLFEPGEILEAFRKVR
jgi:2-oxoglutarate ferredoxin oxidoreductase subunit alpha